MRYRLVFWIFISIITILFSGCHSNKVSRKGKTAKAISTIDAYSITTQLQYKKQALLLDKYFRDLYDQQIFSGSILIAKHGIIIYKGAYGLANRSSKIPLSSDYAFGLGSVTKQFTSISILLLQQRGLLNLEDSVQKFFPNFPYRNVTIKLLLTHRSGLPNYNYFCDNMLLDKFKPLTNTEMVQIMCDSFPEKYYPANKSYHYCNTNYAILAAIIEKASKMSFENFVKKEIFIPLGMTHSFFYSDSTFFNNHKVATGYLSPKAEAGFFYMNGINGDKGIFSTVDDMLKWDLALYSNEPVKKEISHNAFIPQTKTRRHNIFYGYGWKMYYLEDSTRILFHSGWWRGYQAVIMRIPKDKTTVIILKNKKTSHPVDQRAMIDILFPGNHFFNSNFKPENLEEQKEGSAD